MQQGDDAIRSRAYALWESEGRPEGRHEDHWRQAQAEMGEHSDEGAAATPAADEAAMGGPAEAADTGAAPAARRRSGTA